MKKALLFLFMLPAAVNAKVARIDSLLRVLELSKTDTDRVNIYNELSRATIEIDSLQALQYANRAIALAERTGYVKGKINALYDLADLYDFHASYKRAGQYYLEGLRLAKAAHLVRELSTGYHHYSLVLRDLGDPKGSLRYNDSALATYVLLNDSDRMAVIYTNIGNNFKNLDQFDTAIRYHLLSLNYYQRKNNYLGVARAYNNIGVIYLRMRNDALALPQFEKMLALSIQAADTTFIAKAYENIGACYVNLSQDNKALVYLRKAYDLQKKRNNKRSMIIVLTNIVASLNNTKAYSEAIDVSKKAIALSIETEDNVNLAYSYKGLAEAYFRAKNYKESEQYLSKALAIANRENETDLFQEIYTLFDALYAGQGNFKKAYEYKALATRLKDSMMSVERNEKIAALQTKYETERKETELAEARATNAQNALILQRRSGLLIISVSMAGMLVIVLVLVFRNARLQRARLQKEADLSLQIASIEAHNQLQDEKLRISGELHDNIGSQLAFIHSSLSHADSRQPHIVLEEMQKMTLNTMRELRRTVWLINKNEFQLGEFVLKVKEYAAQLHSLKPVINVNVAGDSGDLLLSATTATNLFRIIQEAISNALKYAQCNLITVDIDNTTPGVLNITVCDDGGGFEHTEQQTGFGLKNIMVRVNKLNGTCNIESAKNKGTSIHVSMPLS